MDEHPEREPGETELPDKPPVQDMPDPAGDPPPTTEEADVTTFMRPQDAADDPTVDNEENDAV